MELTLFLTPARKAGSGIVPVTSWLEPAGSHLEVSILPFLKQSTERTVEPSIRGFLVTSQRDLSELMQKRELSESALSYVLQS